MEAQRILEEHPHAHVERRPGVQGGRPVIRGTRVLVSTLVVTYRGGASIEDLLADFPHLRPAQIHDALSYYYDHQDEIDREIDELNSEQAVMTRFPPTLSTWTSSAAAES